MTARTLVIPTLVVVGLALAGCTDKPDSTATTSAPATTTSAAPTTEAPADPSQTSPDEARNAYLNYVDVRNQVSQDYFRDWDTKFLDLSTGEERMAVVANWRDLADQGYHAVGADVVKTIPQVLVYDDTDLAGNYRAEMKACVDTSETEAVAEGRETIRKYPDGRFYYAVVMQRVVNYDAEGNALPDPYGQGWWRVASEHGDPERPC